HIGKSLTADKIAPEADAAIAAVHSINRNNVGMADARNRSRLRHNGGVFAFGIKSARQQKLQRDLTLQSRVPCMVNFAKAAGPQLLKKLKFPPLLAPPAGIRPARAGGARPPRHPECARRRVYRRKPPFR